MTIAFARLFNPTVEVRCGGQRVRSVGGEGLRVRFQVTRTLTATPDSAEVAITGLAPERRTALSQGFSTTGRAVLEIDLGYDDQASRVFKGDVRRPLQAARRNGPEFETVIRADDGGDLIAKATISLALVGRTPEEMVDSAIAGWAQLFGIQIQKHPSVTETFATTTLSKQRVLAKVVHIGDVWDLVVEAARIVGARAWVRDGQLFMARRNRPIDGLAVDLPRKLWLSEPDEDGDGFVRVSANFDPNLVPGRQVRLDGDPARIEAVTFSGDTRTPSPWAAQLHCKRIDGT